jgi:hypothetical protein
MDITANEESRLILLVVVIPLGLFLVITPFIMVNLDFYDLKKLEADDFNVSDVFLDKFHKRTKNNHIEEVYYKISELQDYLSFTNFSAQSCNNLKVNISNFHPVANLFSKFDYGIKRMTRLSFLFI